MVVRGPALRMLRLGSGRVLRHDQSGGFFPTALGAIRPDPGIRRATRTKFGVRGSGFGHRQHDKRRRVDARKSAGIAAKRHHCRLGRQSFGRNTPPGSMSLAGFPTCQTRWPCRLHRHPGCAKPLFPGNQGRDDVLRGGPIARWPFARGSFFINRKAETVDVEASHLSNAVSPARKCSGMSARTGDAADLRQGGPIHDGRTDTWRTDT